MSNNKTVQLSLFDFVENKIVTQPESDWVTSMRQKHPDYGENELLEALTRFLLEYSRFMKRLP